MKSPCRTVLRQLGQSSDYADSPRTMQTVLGLHGQSSDTMRTVLGQSADSPRTVCGQSSDSLRINSKDSLRLLISPRTVLGLHGQSSDSVRIRGGRVKTSQPGG